jgi:chromosome partitioning protein
VLVGDTDEQQTAFRWAHCAEKPFPATVISLVGTKEDVYEKVSEQSENFDFILLDTSPSTTSPIVHACLLLSDVAIVPVQPAPPDIWSALATASLIAGVQKANPRLRARILANRVQRTSLSRMVLGAMSDFGIPMMRSRLSARVAYQEAALAGGSLALLGNGAKAAKEEVAAVVDEFLEFVGGEK